MVDATKKAMDAGNGGKELPAPAPRARRGLIQFIREVRREGIDKVTWPTVRETYLTTIMVFIMVGLTMAFFFVVDWLLAYGERLLIGAVS
jgi:preprotein translocase subunit SecE